MAVEVWVDHTVTIITQFTNFVEGFTEDAIVIVSILLSVYVSWVVAFTGRVFSFHWFSG